METPRALVLLLSLAAVPAAAQMPQATAEQIAALQVHTSELQYLYSTHQIDARAFGAQRVSTQAKINSLWKPYRTLPASEQQSAISEIQGTVQARLAILQPQWQAKAQQLAQQAKDKDKSLRAKADAAARQALRYERQMLSLSQQRERGKITPADFQKANQAALGSIQTLRAPLAAAGPFYAQEFDHRLKLFTQALNGNPSTPLPEAQVSAGGQGRTSPDDYQKDVVLAAGLTRKETALSKRYEAHAIAPATYRESDVVYQRDLSRLRQKWQAVSPQKAVQFERDVQNAVAPRAADVTVARAGDGGASTAGSSSGISLTPWIFGVGAVGLFLLYVFRKKPAPVDPAPPLSENYGTATFAPLFVDVANVFDTRIGVFLGKSSAPQLRDRPIDLPGAPIFTTPEHHTLIVARTRTGKGTRVIIPTLLRYVGSALVIDPKGENAAITARTRRDGLGQNVHIVNPWNELPKVLSGLGFQPATFNPLDALDRKDPNIVATAQSLAATICPPATHDKDGFWQGSAASVLAAVFLWLADQPGERKTLARARELVSMSRSAFTKEVLSKMAVSSAFGGAIREMASQYIDLADETYSGIMANVNEATKFLSDPQIKVSTETSSFALEDLIRDHTTIYLVVPPDRINTQRTWLRLIVAAAMHAFKRFPHHQRPAHRCQFLIDEFAALGRIEDLPRDIATMSGYGVDFTLIVQGLDQLKDLYRDAAGTILSNCAFKWFCNVGDLESAKYLSETLGKATKRTVGKSKGTSTNNHGDSQSDNITYGEMGRSLLNPDEVLTLGRDVAITLHPLTARLYLRPVDYWRLEEAFDKLREKHPDLFWKPPLEYDANPYVPGSRGTRKESEHGANEGAGDRQRSSFSGEMTEDEAREILGVTAAATAKEIKAAYARLMAKVHPDKGGSNVFARQLNAAKVVLLGE